MENNNFSGQIEYGRNAQSIKGRMRNIVLCTPFALSLFDLQTSFYDNLQEPTLGNELKYEFKQLGAAEKIRKQEEIQIADERRWAWQNQDW